MQTTARLFDALLLEGSKVLHRVALAVFKLAEPHLLRCRDTVACANALRVMLRHTHDRDALMRTALRRVGSLPMATIDRLRAAQSPDYGLMSRLLRLRGKRGTARLKPAPWQCNLVRSDSAPGGVEPGGGRRAGSACAPRPRPLLPSPPCYHLLSCHACSGHAHIRSRRGLCWMTLDDACEPGAAMHRSVLAPVTPNARTLPTHALLLERCVAMRSPRCWLTRRVLGSRGTSSGQHTSVPVSTTAACADHACAGAAACAWFSLQQSLCCDSGQLAQEIASAMQRSFSSVATGRTHTRSMPTAIDISPEALPNPASRRHSRSRSRADTASSHHSPQRSIGAAAAAFPADLQFPDTPLAGRTGTEFTLDSSTAMSPGSDTRGDATASLDDRTLKLVQMQQALDNASLFREMDVESHMLFNFTVVRAGTGGSGPDPAPASGGSSVMERRSDRSAAAMRTGSMRSPRGLPKPAPGLSGSTLPGGGLSGGTGHLSYSAGPSVASLRGGRSGDAPSADAPSSLTASILNLPGPPQMANVLHGPRGEVDAVPAHAEADPAAPMWTITSEGLVRAGGQGYAEDRLPGPPRSRGERQRAAMVDRSVPLLPPRARGDVERGRAGLRERCMHVLGGEDSLFMELGSAVGAPIGIASSRSTVPPMSGAEMWVTAAESFGPGELSGPTSGSSTLREGSMTLQLSK